MAAVKPGSIPPSTLHVGDRAPAAGSLGLARRADPEVTVTRHFEPPAKPAVTRRVKQPETPVDPDIDWNDYSTLARGALPDGPDGPDGQSNDEPATLARPLAAERGPDTERERDRLDDARRSTPIVQVDVATLTKAARELETLPREKKPLLSDYDRTENTGATLVRRDSIHPPPLPPTLPPPMHPPLRSAPEPTMPTGKVEDGPAEESSTGITPVVHTGSLPWVTSLPSIDPTPPPAPAIRTPLVMVTAPEDNLTRVAPLTGHPYMGQACLDPHPSLSPPYPNAPASKLPVPRIAMAASALLAVVAILALVAIRPRVKVAAASAPGPTPVEVVPVVAASPPPVAPVVAPSPPLAANPAPVQPPVATTVAKTPPKSPSTAPRPAVRAEPRRHGPAAKPARATSRPAIPVRREP